MFFKKSLAINPTENLFKVYTNDKSSDNLEALNNNFKIEFDTGNETYTLVSEKFFEFVDDRKYTDVIYGVNVKTGSIGGDISSYTLIKFRIIFNDDEFIIVAIVDNSLSKIGTDILFGSKCGLDLFYSLNYSIDAKYFNNSDNSDNKLRVAYQKFIIDFDKFIINSFGMNHITIEYINDFIINILFLEFTFNKNIDNLHTVKTLNEIKLMYDKYISDGNDILDVFKHFINSSGLLEAGGRVFFFDFSHEKYNNFTEEHFRALKILHKLYITVKMQIKKNDFNNMSFTQFKETIRVKMSKKAIKKEYEKYLKINKDKFNLFLETVRRLLV
jgi:hypothetical protein